MLDQLPEKVETVIRCELSGWQRKLYNTIHNRSVAAKEKDSVGSGLNNAIMQLRKQSLQPPISIPHRVVHGRGFDSLVGQV